jgi:hypothetical protein
MIHTPRSPSPEAERLDLHNASIDESAAAAGTCGTIHLPSGRVCRAPAHHVGGCDFGSPS